MPSKRPEGWQAARKKRVYKKEVIESAIILYLFFSTIFTIHYSIFCSQNLDRLRGIDEPTIEKMHRQREIDEEKIMLDEVQKYGKQRTLILLLIISPIVTNN